MMAAAERQAAHVAEHLLDHSNADAERELALDILNDYCDGVHVAMYGQRAMGLLAWALQTVESTFRVGGRSCGRNHEMKLIELAWEKVRADAAAAEWERMGRR